MGVDRGRRRADHPDLRPLRRAAAGAAGGVAKPALRAHHPRRADLRPRRLDDKSPLWIAVSALEAWLAVHGRLPVNVKVLLEARRKSAAPACPRSWRRTAACSPPTCWCRPTAGAGGRTADGEHNTRHRRLEVHVRTAGHDLHSGRFGGPVGNAPMVLARLLAACTTRTTASPSPASSTGCSRQPMPTRRHGGARLRRGPSRRHRRPPAPWSPGSSCWNRCGCARRWK